MSESTKLIILLTLLLFLFFPFAGLAPLIILAMVGVAGMILRLISAITIGLLKSANPPSAEKS